MKLKITDVDFAPEDLYGQVPFEVTLLCELVGLDRPEYWLAELANPVRWVKDGTE